MNNSGYAFVLSHAVKSTFLFSLLFLVAACSGPTIDSYSSDLRNNLMEFSGQKEDSVQSYQEAYEARVNAMEAGFEYANADTRTFITKWNEATKEIVSLREKFNNVIEASDFFFAYCEKKGLQIKDKTIKARVFAAIDAKKDSFADACRKSSKAITSLERSMQQGQDIISALEIAGALRGIQGKIRELDVLHDQATSKLPAIDQLVDEGLNILNAEFESL